MRVKLDLEPDATERLIAAAIGERRPIPMHAEVMLRRALGLPDQPAQMTSQQQPNAPLEPAVAHAR